MISRHPHNNISKIAIVCCSLIATTAHANYISRDRIAFNVDEQANMILRSHGYSAGGIPTQFQAEYDGCKQQARKELDTMLSQSWRIFTDEDEIKRVVETKLTTFIATLNTLVFVHEIDDKVTQKINNFLSTHGYTQSSVPKDSLQIFYAKKYSIIQQLHERMTRDNRCYVRSSEVDQLVTTAYAEFIASLNSPSPIVDWLCDVATNWNKPSAPQTPPTVGATYFTASQIESAVMTNACQTLRAQGIDPNNVPARAVSDYSEHIQKSIKRAQKFAAATWDKKIAKCQIETIVQEELKPVIDKITLRSEQCAICQDGYKQGQSIGYLGCGHLFHDDCIHTSLAYKQQCPLCRASATFVAKKEVVK